MVLMDTHVSHGITVLHHQTIGTKLRDVMDDISSIGEPIDGPGPRRQLPEDLSCNPGSQQVIGNAVIPTQAA
jgi:hypothetical protein